MFFRKITQNKNRYGISKYFWEDISHAKKISNGLLNVLAGKERIEDIERYEYEEKPGQRKRRNHRDPACIANIILFIIIIFKMIIVIKGIDISDNIMGNLIYNTGTDIIALLLGINSLKKSN